MPKRHEIVHTSGSYFILVYTINWLISLTVTLLQALLEYRLLEYVTD
jgi:hypothetical protein